MKADSHGLARRVPQNGLQGPPSKRALGGSLRSLSVCQQHYGREIVFLTIDTSI
jgi:hypothetical protein